MKSLWQTFLWLLLLALLTPPMVVVGLRWLPPPTSAFMLLSPTQPVDYRWVPATAHADALRKAVLAAEDQKFWSHNGFDFEAIEKALAHNQKSRRVRGASTISQQVAKNLFLWNERSWLRKGLEVSFTVLIEACLPKPRILEMYLNIAEFGPGIYGAEAAAQRFFGVSAAKLSPEQAARLAAVLPRPRKWRAASPGPYVQKRAQWILGQMGYRPLQSEPEEDLGSDTDPADLVPPDQLPRPEGPRRSYLTPDST
ncbi:MAG: monofunctional biosynthetic peptidoglycan transglycosylase [Pseudomonadota bacterium]